jgi:hypothetical protein
MGKQLGRVTLRTLGRLPASPQDVAGTNVANSIPSLCGQQLAAGCWVVVGHGWDAEHQSPKAVSREA